MEARRNWKHILVELREHVNSCCNSNVATFSHWFREMIFGQEFADDCFKNIGKYFLGSIWNIDDVEMAHKSRSQPSSTSTWWSSSANDFEVFNLFLEEIGSIIDDVSIKK